MVAVTTRPYYEGSARFNDGEQVDFHQASEHVKPAAALDSERRQQELAQAAARRAYVEQGLDDAAYYANTGRVRTPEAGVDEQALNYLKAASKNLVSARAYMLDTHWSLEDSLPESSRLVGQALKKLWSWVSGDADADIRLPGERLIHGVTERELIQRESAIGRELFGPIPADHRREFFNLDPTTWIWYEEYTDENGKTHSTTTRYEVQEKGILKAQDGARYTYLEGKELAHLTQAIRLYYETVMPKVYERDAVTGQKLAA